MDKLLVLCLRTWEYKGPGVVAGEIYTISSENDRHYIINGTGYYKERFYVIPEEMINTELFKLVVE